MERLTDKYWRNLDLWECCGQDRFCTRGCHDLGGCTDGCIVPKLYARLGKYEDTGLTPERAQELSQAEKDGRLVVLPCKNHESIFYIEDGDWYDDVPYDISIGQKQGEWNDSLLYECEDGFAFFAEDIGKTVFLTQEEAEAELERRVGESDETSDD